jgi:competence protein ComEC
VTVSIAIADVAHGNGAVVRDGDYCAVVDVAPGGTVEQILTEYGVRRVDDVVISHADDDHLGGLPTLLLQFDVRRVWINPDPARSGRAWDAARAALRVAQESGRTTVHAQISAGTVIDSPTRAVRLRVLAPFGWNLLWGSGSAAPGQATNTANSLSAIVAVEVNGAVEALLPGDAGYAAFKTLNAAAVDLRAPLLVFPHHGGRPGRHDPGAFAANVCAVVEPEVVVFSVGRSPAGFPRPDVVAAVRTAAPSAHVACTQLAQECAADTPDGEPGHLHPLPASGRPKTECCMGTFQVTFPAAGRTTLPLLAAHADFVRSAAPTRMCR